jgi:hypothetical protein
MHEVENWSEEGKQESETIMKQEGLVREKVSLERVEQARERDRQTESNSPNREQFS